MMHLVRTILLFAIMTSSTFAQDAKPRPSIAYDEQQPALGHWVGDMKGAQGGEQFAIIEITRDEDDAPAGKVTIITAALVATPCNVIEVEDRSVSLAIPAGGGSLQLSGDISEDGQQFAGKVMFTVNDQQDQAGTFDLHRWIAPTTLSSASAFTGELAVGAVTIPMTMTIAQIDDSGEWVGSLDVPSQMLREYPIINITEEDGWLTGTVPVPAPATVRVKVEEQPKRLVGAFMQAGMHLAVDFAHDPNYAYREASRPQHPKPPYPYETREIIAKHPNGFSLAGTLTIPDPEEFGEGPFPTAVLISGSGQQDRDETLLGHKPFLVIADFLTRHGIAVMRYDDRGVGGSSVDDMKLVTEATSHDFATDCAAVVKRLREEPGVDGEKIGLIGHSEGGLIAPIAWEMDHDIAFLILLAGPGVRGDELLLKQLALTWASVGINEDVIAQLTERMSALQQMVIDRAPEVDMRKALIEMHAIEVESGLSTEDAADAQLQMGLSMMNNAWMHSFFTTDPAPLLAKVECPVLAMNGTLDLQVWHEQNLDAIERVMTEAGRDITVRRYEGLNHLFQPAKTGSPAEYAGIEITFDEKVMRDMVEWIEQKVGGGNE